jgi:hypothetical protein
MLRRQNRFTSQITVEKMLTLYEILILALDRLSKQKEIVANPGRRTPLIAFVEL